MFLNLKHVAPAMELELNVAMTLKNAPDAEVKAGWWKLKGHPLV